MYVRVAIMIDGKIEHIYIYVMGCNEYVRVNEWACRCMHACMRACMYVHMHAYLYIERDVREAAYICAYSLKFCGIDNC